MTTTVSDALASGDPATLARALAEHSVVVPVAARDGAVVPLVLVDGAGVRCLPAFTSQDALDRWGHGGTVEVVPGPDVARLAAVQQADQVLFDPAGPVPVRLSPDVLATLSDGVVTDGDGLVLVGDLQVLPARGEDATVLAERLRPWLAAVPSAEVWLVDRLAGGHAVLTVAVHGSADDVDAVRRAVAERAAGIAVVDVLHLDRATRDALDAELPGSRLRTETAG